MNVVERLNASLAGRYVIEGEAGAGGMAVVYVARDTKHNRKVALKVLRPEVGSLLGPERFLSEIAVTARLQHPHLLPLFDSGEADGRPTGWKPPRGALRCAARTDYGRPRRDRAGRGHDHRRRCL